MNQMLKAIMGIFKKNPQTPTPLMKGRVAICVGHSRIGDAGAVSVGKVSEWRYNSQVAEALRKRLVSVGVEADVIANYPRQTYGAAMKWLGNSMKGKEYDCAVELHFNSAGPTANGYEYLHLNGSRNGKNLATFLSTAHEKSVGENQRNRGIHAISQEQRGHGFLQSVQPPAVICEPFFGSNKNEWEMYACEQENLAGIYFDGITEFLLSIHGKTANQSVAQPRSP